MVPPTARLVEVIADLGSATKERYRYGSGCIIAGRTVLTAAHVVTSAVSVVVRDTAKHEYAATWTSSSSEMRTDLVPMSP